MGRPAVLTLGIVGLRCVFSMSDSGLSAGCVGRHRGGLRFIDPMCSVVAGSIGGGGDVS
jgi:hypothetical protein